MYSIVGMELLFVVLWSSGFIGATYGLPYAGPFTLLFIRYGLVSILLLAWLSSRGELRWWSFLEEYLRHFSLRRTA